MKLWALIGVLIAGPALGQQAAPPAGTYKGQTESGKSSFTLLLKSPSPQSDGSVVYQGLVESKAAPGTGGSNQPEYPLSKAVYANGVLAVETQDQGKVTSKTNYAWDGAKLTGKMTYMPFRGSPATFGMTLVKQ